MASTRDRILNVSERLFAEGGVAGTSLRSIIDKAKVNQAAVHYHFGSKSALLQAVVDRKLVPVNDERLARLDALEADPVELELRDVIRAYVGPALHLSHDSDQSGATFMKLIVRLFHEGGGQTDELLSKQFERIMGRFAKAMKKCLPDVSPKAFAWRFHFVMGALGYTMCDRHLVGIVGDGKAHPDDPEEAIEHIVEFAAAGLLAPAAKRTRRSKKTVRKRGKA